MNNNAYTNLMARENLRYAAQTVEALRQPDADAYDALVDKTELEQTEVEAWNAPRRACTCHTMKS